VKMMLERSSPDEHCLTSQATPRSVDYCVENF
jgi:hypothetical protein